MFTHNFSFPGMSFIGMLSINMYDNFTVFTVNYMQIIHCITIYETNAAKSECLMRTVYYVFHSTLNIATILNLVNMKENQID